MFRMRAVFIMCAGSLIWFSTMASAASISLSDAIQDFPGDSAELTAPLSGNDVPDVDQSVMNTSETPVIQPPKTDNMAMPFDDLVPNFFQPADSNLLGISERIMNEDGTMASIPFQL